MIGIVHSHLCAVCMNSLQAQPHGVGRKGMGWQRRVVSNTSLSFLAPPPPPPLFQHMLMVVERAPGVEVEQ